MKGVTEINGEPIIVYEGYDFSILDYICANFFAKGVRRGNSWYPPNNKIDLSVEDHEGTFEEYEQEILKRGIE